MLAATPQKSRTVLSPLQVSMNNILNPVSSCQKVLGIHIQNDLDWSVHKNKIISKVKSNLFLLKRIKPYLSSKAKRMYCNSYILRHLDYVSSVWGNTKQEHLGKLLRLQKRAARLTLNDYDSASADLFKELNWLPIKKQHINYNNLILVYKSLTNFVLNTWHNYSTTKVTVSIKWDPKHKKC